MSLEGNHFQVLLGVEKVMSVIRFVLQRPICTTMEKSTHVNAYQQFGASNMARLLRPSSAPQAVRNR